MAAPRLLSEERPNQARADGCSEPRPAERTASPLWPDPHALSVCPTLQVGGPELTTPTKLTPSLGGLNRQGGENVISADLFGEPLKHKLPAIAPMHISAIAATPSPH